MPRATHRAHGISYVHGGTSSASTGKSVSFGLQETFCFVKIFKQSECPMGTKMVSFNPFYQAGEEKLIIVVNNFQIRLLRIGPPPCK